MASRAVEKLLKELWETQQVNEEDVHTLRTLFEVIGRPISPATIQQELSEDTRYRAQAASLWRRLRKARELAEEELDSRFYTLYNSLRTLKDGEADAKEEGLPLPVLKSQSKARKQESPRGHFSKDLVKSHALKDPGYRQQAQWVVTLKYFEGEMEDLYKAFQARHDNLSQWSNNYRRLYGEDE